jgi:hypothetical protein
MADLYSGDRASSDTVELDEGVRLQRVNDGRQLALDQHHELTCPQVPGSDEQQLVWPLLQDVGVVEVGVFGDDDALLGNGQVALMMASRVLFWSGSWLVWMASYPAPARMKHRPRGR